MPLLRSLFRLKTGEKMFGNLLDAVLYVAGVSLVFFMIPSLLMFGLTELVCKKIENGTRKANA